MSSPAPQDLPQDPLDRALQGFFEALEREEFASPEPFRKVLSPTDQKRFDAALDIEAALLSGLPHALGTGQRLGRYRLGNRLGEGGTGEVFRAHDDTMEAVVALKTLRPGLVNQQFRERFTREPRVLAGLNHPSIVRVFDAGTVECKDAPEQSLHYMVMELVPGRPLDQVLNDLRGAAPTPTAVDVEQAIGRHQPEVQDSMIRDRWIETATGIFRSIVRGVAEVHHHGILHRDLKPGNIILRAGAHPVVLDFGLARTVGAPQGKLTQGLYGSPPYIAPEQLDRKQIGTSARTDVYQLGLILYELLTLQTAFSGSSVPEITRRIQDWRFPWPRQVQASIPRDLEAICLKAMHRDPRRRYADASALGADLDRYLAGHPVRARTPGRFDRGRMWARRNPALSVGLLSTVVIAVLAVAWLAAPDPVTLIEGMAIRISDGVSHAELNPTRPLRRDDGLGFRAMAPDPAHVMALYALRDDTGDVRALQMAQLISVPDWHSGALPSHYVVRLGREAIDLVAIQVREDELTSARAELWVIEAADAESFDDPRFHTLRRLTEDYGHTPIPYDRLQPLLRDLVHRTSRGGLGEAPEWLQRRFQDPEQAARVFEAETWSVPGQKRHSLHFALASPPHS